MVVIPKFLLPPKNADCTAWSLACNFWRKSTDVCPVKLDVFGTTFFGAPNVMTMTGDLITGTFGSTCGGSSSYITESVGASFWHFYIDVWKALADGAWSSSMAIAIQMGNTAVPPSSSITAIREDGLANPSSATKAVTPTSPTSCAMATLATLTVYDDGTFTLT